MNFKRGQAAMEYLMTYGWAILVIVIVLAALLYLGIFNLNPPEVCTMPAGMSCPKSYLRAGTAPATATTDCAAANGCMNATFVNGLQKTIVVTNVSITKNANSFDACTSAVRCINWVSGTGVTVPLGSQFSVMLPVTDENGVPMAISSGDAFSGKINIVYYFKDEGASATRKITGNVYAKAA